MRKLFLLFATCIFLAIFISASFAGDSIWVPSGQTLTPAGAQILFPGRPNAIAINPDGNIAVANVEGRPNDITPGYSPIVVMDLNKGKVIQNISLSKSEYGGSYTGIVYSKDGSKLYASFSDGKILDFNVEKDGLLALDKVIEVPKDVDGKSSDPGGLAISPDGSKLYVALSRNNLVGVIDLATGKLVKQIPVGNAPYTILIDSDNPNFAFVSNQGGRVATAQDFTNYSSGTPIVSDPVSGRASTGTVSVIDLKTDSVIKNIPVGLQPTAMCQDKDYVFVTNTNQDTISVINKQSKAVVKTISIHPYPNSIFGSQPNAIAVSPDDKKLFVGLGSDNAIAVYDWNGEDRAVKFDGLIPAAWYPSDVVFDKTLNSIVVANMKGVGSLGKEVPFVEFSKKIKVLNETESLGKEDLKSYGHSVYAWYTAPTCQDYFFIIHLPIPSLTHG